ncbi:MAG: glycosyltransferase family 39 protein [Acidobacteriaceae bacterium]
MQLARRVRFPAIFCALAVLLCELISRPYANMGISDDGPYILMAQHLATTGHIAYNGWAAPMLGWQLYLGAAFIKLFGFSLTTVRMSTLLVAVLMAFVLQRTLVRACISERNAIIGTLALVLSPLYLKLSVTFMSDITGLFAIVLCLYGCLRALRASSSRAAIAWIAFAALTNALCGTSRQIAWLGVLVMVPSALWLLRARRRVLLSGALFTLVGDLFVLASLHWLKFQRYHVTEHLIPKTYSVGQGIWDLAISYVDISFILLAIVILFSPQLFKLRPRVIALLFMLFIGYCFVAIRPNRLRGHFPLEPILSTWGNVHGVFEWAFMKGVPSIFLSTDMRVLLTFVSFGGMLGLIVSLLRNRRSALAGDSHAVLSWAQLGVLLAPFTLAYSLLLFPRAASTGVGNRYLLAMLVVAVVCLVRYYQERIQSRLPLAGVLMVFIMAIYGMVVVHNSFAFYRARVEIAAELASAGVPNTAVDNGWEYNLLVELQHANHLNDPHLRTSENGYIPPPSLPAGTCFMPMHEVTIHIRPIYGIAFSPDVCYGPAPFTPVHYSRWPYSTPGTLYAVRYLPRAKP